MSYLKRYRAICGRSIKKPNAVDDDAENDDELPLQTQIDNLRAKISLKERYNKALFEEVTESHAGANQMINDLLAENDSLRYEKNDAIANGKEAVIKALRNHRTFLLALRGKEPYEVLAWLEDQLGDQRRILDEKMYLLTLLKNRLGEAEVMIEELEKWPFPGSSPWEQDAIKKFTRLGIAIARMEVLRECGKLLNSKYIDICTELKAERTAWPYAVLRLEKLLLDLKKELADLQQMLNDAIRFKKNTFYRLVMAEKEYADNKKARHKRLTRMRKLCQEELRKNHKKFHKTVAKVMTDSNPTSKLGDVVDVYKNSYADVKLKKEQVTQFEEKAKLLVEAMRVRDLRYCPSRIHTVRHIANVLGEEREKKEIILKMLLKRKGNLILIKNHLLYTGCAKLEAFQHECAERQAKLDDINKQKHSYEVKIKKISDYAVDLHQALFGLIDHLNERKRRPHPDHEHYLRMGKLMKKTVSALVAEIKNLRSKFDPNVQPQRNYGYYVKMPMSKDNCRLSALHHSSEEEASDDDVDAATTGIGSERVLDRDELKEKSARIFSRAMLRVQYITQKAEKVPDRCYNRSVHSKIKKLFNSNS